MRYPFAGLVWIATDPDHIARAVILARIAYPRPAEHRKLVRDALRLRSLPVSGRVVGCRGGSTWGALA